MATEDDWAAYRAAVVDLVPPGRPPFRIVPTDTDHSGQWPEGVAPPVVVVTAWNPDSTPLGPAENALRHRALVAELAELGLDWWPATGRDPGHLHAEQGVAIPGLSEVDGVRIGRAHGQAAVYLWTPAAWEVVSCTDGRRHTSGWDLTAMPGDPPPSSIPDR